MNRESLIARAVEDLCNASDGDRGRRLALVCQVDGWRIGYQVPRYWDPELWSRGDVPIGWDILDWLGDKFGDLAEASGVALGLRVIVLARVSAVARAGVRPGELLIVVEAPPIWTLQVEPTPAQQWRWGVLDMTGTEIVGRGGYDSEDDAWEAGEAELAVQARPGPVIV